MSWITKEEWLAAEPDPLTKVAAGIIGHMTDGHADALVTYCKARSRRRPTRPRRTVHATLGMISELVVLEP